MGARSLEAGLVDSQRSQPRVLLTWKGSLGISSMTALLGWQLVPGRRSLDLIEP